MRIGPAKRVIEVDPVEEPVPAFAPEPEEPVADPGTPPSEPAPEAEPVPDNEPAGTARDG